MTRDLTATIHPRFLSRLEDTLAVRLKDFERARGAARRVMTDVRNRVRSLEDTLGVPLTECRTACDVVLETLDSLDALQAENGADLGPLTEQITCLTTLVDRLNAVAVIHAATARQSTDPAEDRAALAGA